MAPTCIQCGGYAYQNPLRECEKCKSKWHEHCIKRAGHCTCQPIAVLNPSDVVARMMRQLSDILPCIAFEGLHFICSWVVIDMVNCAFPQPLMINAASFFLFWVWVYVHDVLTLPYGLASVLSNILATSFVPLWMWNTYQSHQYKPPACGALQVLPIMVICAVPVFQMSKIGYTTFYNEVAGERVWASLLK